MDALRNEITMVKTFFADLEKANLEKGRQVYCRK